MWGLRGAMSEIKESSPEYVQTVGRAEVLPQDWTGHVRTVASAQSSQTILSCDILP